MEVWIIEGCVQLAVSQINNNLVDITSMNRLHGNKRPKLPSSTGWKWTPPIKGLITRCGGERLSKRLGNPFTKLETEDLKVRAVLKGGCLGK
jgi:hypothetical protein